MTSILIHSPDGKKLHPEEVEILATHDRDFTQERFASGCVFRSLTGKTFFLGFGRFTFWQPAIR